MNLEKSWKDIFFFLCSLARGGKGVSTVNISRTRELPCEETPKPHYTFTSWQLSLSCDFWSFCRFWLPVCWCRFTVYQRPRSWPSLIGFLPKTHLIISFCHNNRKYDFLFEQSQSMTWHPVSCGRPPTIHNPSPDDPSTFDLPRLHIYIWLPSCPQWCPKSLRELVMGRVLGAAKVQQVIEYIRAVHFQYREFLFPCHYLLRVILFMIPISGISSGPVAVASHIHISPISRWLSRQWRLLRGSPWTCNYAPQLRVIDAPDKAGPGPGPGLCGKRG